MQTYTFQVFQKKKEKYQTLIKKTLESKLSLQSSP